MGQRTFVVSQWCDENCLSWPALMRFHFARRFCHQIFTWISLRCNERAMCERSTRERYFFCWNSASNSISCSLENAVRFRRVEDVDELWVVLFSEETEDASSSSLSLVVKLCDSGWTEQKRAEDEWRKRGAVWILPAGMVCSWWSCVRSDWNNGLRSKEAEDERGSWWALVGWLLLSNASIEKFVDMLKSSCVPVCAKSIIICMRELTKRTEERKGERERRESAFRLVEIFHWRKRVYSIIDWLMFVFVFTPSPYQGAALNC